MRGEKGSLESWVRAANDCGVSVAELRDWMLANVKANPDRWSKWDNAVEKIPKRHLLAFMRAKVEAAGLG